MSIMMWLMTLTPCKRKGKTMANYSKNVIIEAIKESLRADYPGALEELSEIYDYQVKQHSGGVIPAEISEDNVYKIIEAICVDFRNTHGFDAEEDEISEAYDLVRAQ